MDDLPGPLPISRGLATGFDTQAKNKLLKRLFFEILPLQRQVFQHSEGADNVL